MIIVVKDLKFIDEEGKERVGDLELSFLVRHEYEEGTIHYVGFKSCALATGVEHEQSTSGS